MMVSHSGVTQPNGSDTYQRDQQCPYEQHPFYLWELHALRTQRIAITGSAQGIAN
jgi:hypothetical protein